MDDEADLGDLFNPDPVLGAVRSVIDEIPSRPTDIRNIPGINQVLTIAEARQKGVPEKYLRPSWESRDRAIDSAFLPADWVAPSRFMLSSEILLTAIERNDFIIHGNGRKFIFGIRGASLQESQFDSGWQSSVELRITDPDHTVFKCLIGVFDLTTRQFRVFTGSTVPERNYLLRHLVNKAAANMMPTGAYTYAVGTHRAGKPRQQVKALRLLGRRFQKNSSGRSVMLGKIRVLRSFDDLAFRPTENDKEKWDYLNPGNNIHASIAVPPSISQRVSPSRNIWFSSAGCQVVRGSYIRETKKGNDGKNRVHFTNDSTGEWKAFQDASGIRNAPDGTEYDYFLLSAYDFAFLSDPSQLDLYRPLRFGSEGARVAALQSRMRLNSDGIYGNATVKALIESCQSLRIPESAVFMNQQL